MTIRQSWSGSGMTIDRVAPSKASPVRLTTPYLEVETQPTSSAERAIWRERAQVGQATTSKRKGGYQPSHRVA
jgi:hypothetical protein